MAFPAETWDEIRRRWETGKVSCEQLASDFDVSPSAIKKRKAAERWTKTLQAAVEIEADRRGAHQLAAEVSGKSSEVPTKVSKAYAVRDPFKDEGAIQVAAESQVIVVREHRIQIKTGRNLAETLFAQLTDAIGNRDALEEIIIEETSDADDLSANKDVRAQAAQRRKAMLAAVSLPAHAGTLRDLSMVLKNLIPLERQAFGLKNEEEKPPMQVFMNLDMRGQGRG